MYIWIILRQELLAALKNYCMITTPWRRALRAGIYLKSKEVNMLTVSSCVFIWASFTCNGFTQFFLATRPTSDDNRRDGHLNESIDWLPPPILGVLLFGYEGLVSTWFRLPTCCLLWRRKWNIEKSMGISSATTCSLWRCLLAALFSWLNMSKVNIASLTWWWFLSWLNSQWAVLVSWDDHVDAGTMFFLVVNISCGAG